MYNITATPLLMRIILYNIGCPTLYYTIVLLYYSILYYIILYYYITLLYNITILLCQLLTIQILKDFGADVAALDVDGLSSLHYAASSKAELAP